MKNLSHFGHLRLAGMTSLCASRPYCRKTFCWDTKRHRRFIFTHLPILRDFAAEHYVHVVTRACLVSNSPVD